MCEALNSISTWKKKKKYTPSHTVNTQGHGVTIYTQPHVQLWYTQVSVLSWANAWYSPPSMSLGLALQIQQP
jgi:hypothetical protein